MRCYWCNENHVDLEHITKYCELLPKCGCVMVRDGAYAPLEPDNQMCPIHNEKNLAFYHPELRPNEKA